MPKRSDAAEYVAPAIEVLPKPTCNMSSRPSLSTSCASLPGWTVRRWPRLVVPTSQPYNSRPDEFATSVNSFVTRCDLESNCLNYQDKYQEIRAIAIIPQNGTRRSASI